VRPFAALSGGHITTNQGQQLNVAAEGHFREKNTIHYSSIEEGAICIESSKQSHNKMELASPVMDEKVA
jgi:hypothetical protein